MIRSLLAALAVALFALPGCASKDSTDNNTGDASVEINTLITSLCQRDFACAGSPAGFSVTNCVVSLEDNLVGSPADCPVSQEETCLKEAVALPCVDAGGPATATAIDACGPCFPPMVQNMPEASPSEPVDDDF